MQLRVPQLLPEVATQTRKGKFFVPKTVGSYQGADGGPLDHFHLRTTRMSFQTHLQARLQQAKVTPREGSRLLTGWTSLPPPCLQPCTHPLSPRTGVCPVWYWRRTSSDPAPSSINCVPTYMVGRLVCRFLREVTTPPPCLTSELLQKTK